MTDHIYRTIEEVEKRLEDQLRAVRASRKMINELLGMAGEPPRYVDEIEPAAGHAPPFRGDEFLGKTQIVAARMCLERRGAPASGNEIYEDLVAGAYMFETDNVPNRRRGLGQALSKASAIFKRLPNDKWGLLKWYPGLKVPREGAADSKAANEPKPDDAASEGVAPEVRRPRRISLPPTTSEQLET